MIVGIGVDIVDIARMEAALRRTPALATRLFTERERAARCDQAAPARWVASLAASFAAKDALAKALGAPVGLIWTDAEVERDQSGRPFLRVRGTVAAAAAQQDITGWHLSISHDGGMCVAMVAGERATERAEPADRAPAPGRAASPAYAESAERVELAPADWAGAPEQARRAPR